jgi:hypothetical protein
MAAVEADQCVLWDLVCATSLEAQIWGSLGAIVVFGFGVLQYRKAQKWKRNEFLAEEIKEFNESKSVRDALSMLDWYGRTIYCDPCDKTSAVWVAHTKASTVYGPVDLPKVTLKRALEYHEDRAKRLSGSPSDKECKFDPAEQHVRDTFDECFRYFERFETLLDNRLFSIRELTPYVAYMVSLMNGMRRHSDGYQRSLFTFLVMYDYERVIKFLARFPQRSDIDRYVAAARARKARMRAQWVAGLAEADPPVTLPEEPRSCFF